MASLQIVVCVRHRGSTLRGGGGGEEGVRAGGERREKGRKRTSTW